MSVHLQEHLDTESAPLAPPPLAAVRDALATGLKANYRDVRVEVKRCPDLRAVGCAWPGLGRHALHRRRGRRALRATTRATAPFASRCPELQRRIGRDDGRVLGAGMACPAAIDGHCGEVTANLDTRGQDASRVARVARMGAAWWSPTPPPCSPGSPTCSSARVLRGRCWRSR